MMQLQSIIDAGAYDEAVEASAERITSAVSCRNITENGGSRSDHCSIVDISGCQEGESSIVDDSISLSSASSYSEDSETCDIENEISYLHKKQLLFKRFLTTLKQEKAYDASKARNVLNGTLPSGSPLWVEAKEVLDILNRRDGTETCLDKRNTLDSNIAKPVHSKRPRIDLGSVVCLSSNSIGDGDLPPSGSHMRAISEAIPLTCGSPWMAQALAHCIPPLSERQDSSALSTWEVISDTNFGLLVIPPSKLPFRDGIRLKDALSFTSNAQLITQSTPPFCVVHANKAFLSFSGLYNGDVLGKAIESVIEVLQEISSPSAELSTKRYLNSRILSSKKSCQLLVTPITDLLRNSQGGMSHILVNVEPSDEND